MSEAQGSASAVEPLAGFEEERAAAECAPDAVVGERVPAEGPVVTADFDAMEAAPLSDLREVLAEYEEDAARYRKQLAEGAPIVLVIGRGAFLARELMEEADTLAWFMRGFIARREDAGASS